MLAKGIIIILAATAITKVLSYGYRIILSRWFGVDTFGVFSLGIAIATLVYSVALSGMNLSIGRFIAFYRGKNDQDSVRRVVVNGVLFELIVSILICVLLFLGAGYIASKMKNPELGILLRILAVMFPFYSFTLAAQKIMEGFQRIDLSAVVDMILNTLRIVFVLAAILFGSKLVGVSSTYVLAAMATAFVVFFILKRDVINIYRLSLGMAFFSRKELKELKAIIMYTLPLTVSYIVHTVLTWGDTILLGLFRSTREVGVYNIASPTANLLSLPTLAVSTPLLPLMSSLFSHDDKTQMIRLYKTATRWMLMMVIPLLSFIILYPQKIISALAGQSFAEGWIALVILSVGAFISALTLPATTVILATEKTKLMMYNSIIAGVVNVILNLFLIPRYGINGAAASACISTTVLSCLRFHEVREIVHSVPWSSRMARIVAAGIGTAAVSYIFNIYLVSNIEYGIVILFLNAVVIGAVYLSLLYAFRSFDEDDKEIFQAMKSRIKVLKSHPE